MNKTTLDTSKKRRLTTIIKAEMKLTLRKKIFAIKKNYFQSIINLHTLKLASNKSMRAYDDEQVSTNCGLRFLCKLFNRDICKVWRINILKKQNKFHLYSFASIILLFIYFIAVHIKNIFIIKENTERFQVKIWRDSSDDSDIGNDIITSSNENWIVDMTVIRNVFQEYCACPECGSKMTLEKRKKDRAGLATKFALTCSNKSCSFYTLSPYFYTTPKQGQSYDINKKECPCK